MSIRDKFLYGFAFFILFFMGIWLVGASLFVRQSPKQGENGPLPKLVSRVSDTRMILKTITLQQKSGFSSSTPSFSDEMRSLADNYLPNNLSALGGRPAEQQVEKEIAENLFPEYYRNAITNMQDAFVLAGWMKEEEKMPLDTEAHVFAALEKNLEILIAHNIYRTEQETELARKTLAAFPKLWDVERQIQRRKKAQGLSFIESLKTFGKAPIPDGKISQYISYKEDIIKGFLAPFLPKEAYAQLNLNRIDDFVTFPECWKAKDRFRREGGDNEWWFCCNCGMCIIPPFKFEFVYDCGDPDGDDGECGQNDCNVQLGCLNFICEGDYNAAFDGPPGYKEEAHAGYPIPPRFNLDWSFTCGCDK